MHKGMKISRVIDESKILTISLKPGWKIRTRITFPQGNIVYKANVPLADVLTGTVIDVPTLDERLISQ